jgi:uncharacterized membrane protein YdjX (TVP38/TMEM64 family)
MFYDVGQRIREHPLGWLLLAVFIRLFTLYTYPIHSPYSSLTEIASFPPMIGHTSMLNLCGFTYGINGFVVAAFASLVASAVVFVVLRYLFGEELRSWSEKNEAWKAVEAVVVSYPTFLAMALA